MREIKFRALDMITNKWVYGLPYREGSEGQWLNIQMENGISVVVIPESVGEFTGLKDKNGREIYEGDIVQIKDHAFQRDKYGIGIGIDGNYVVKWSENMELILSTSIDDDGGWLLNKNLCYVTIIGNIYEHPHLLNEVES